MPGLNKKQLALIQAQVDMYTKTRPTYEENP